MAQIFHPATNVLARVTIFGGFLLLVFVIWLSLELFNWSSFETEENVVRAQPVPFSHQHHVSGLGIDCRYCHASVETSSYADIPPTETCMTCHSRIWADAPMLEPIRKSYRDNVPLTWNKVYILPDFVYFNHSIHVNKGVACETCHGDVGNMPIIYKERPLRMEWCLDCHREPERYIRPRDQVLRTDWRPENQMEIGTRLVKEYDINKAQLTDCSICHR